MTNAFDGAVMMTRYKVRANGPSSMTVTIPPGRGIEAGDDIEFWGRPDEPVDWMHIRKAESQSNHNTNNEPESKDGCNGIDDRQTGN